MCDLLIHGSWGAVYAGCPMRYRVSDEGETVDFTFGQRSNCIELGFDAEGLREFVNVGIEALQEVDALHAENRSSESGLVGAE